MKMENDPATYQHCSVPRPRAEVEASLDAFHKELAELRAKHRIADVVCIVEAHIAGETSATAFLRFGDFRLHQHLVGSVYLSMNGAKTP